MISEGSCGPCGTKNGSSMASLEEPFEAPLFLRVYGVCKCLSDVLFATLKAKLFIFLYAIQ